MPLVLRDEKGAPLTHPEVDGNFRFLRDLVNAARALFDLAFTSAGTLKPNTVNEASLQNRIVTTNKRAFLSNFFYVASGSGDALVVTNALGLSLGAYAAGISLFVKAPSANTGPAAIFIDGLAARAIQKLDGQPLDAGDIPNGGVIELIDDGTKFILIGAVANLQRPQYVVSQGTPTVTPLAGTDVKVGGITLSLPPGATAWKHVRVVFNTRLAPGNSGIDDIQTKIGAVTQDLQRGGSNFVSNRTNAADNSLLGTDDYHQVTYIAEGPPSVTNASIDLEVWAKTLNTTDEVAHRALYAFGIAT